MEGHFLGYFLLIHFIQIASAYRPLSRRELNDSFLSLSKLDVFVFSTRNVTPCTYAARASLLSSRRPFFSFLFQNLLINLKLLISSFADVCLLQLDEGSCLEDVPRFHYDTLTQSCTQFSYSGCGGNLNNFKSYEACYKTCYSIPSMLMLYLSYFVESDSSFPLVR